MKHAKFLTQKFQLTRFILAKRAHINSESMRKTVKNMPYAPF